MGFKRLAARWLTGEFARGRLRWILAADRPEPPPAPIGPVNEPGEERLGICCSGGGIRSASFNLGALQALHAEGVLQNADYLAAVSGGSYIAASYCMVAKTGGPDDSHPDAFEHSRPFAPGSPEEQYLRNHVSYMAPDGLARAYIVLRVFTGLLWNLFLLGLPLVAAGLLLSLLYERHYDEMVTSMEACKGEGKGCGLFADLRPWVWITLAGIAALVILTAGWSLLKRFSHDFWRRVSETWSTRLLVLLLGATVVLVLIPLVIDLLYGPKVDDPDKTTASAAATLSVVTLVGGVILQLRAPAPVAPAPPTLSERAGSLAQAASKAGSAIRSIPARLRMTLVYLIAALLGPVALLSFTTFAAAVALREEWGTWWVVGAAVGLLVAFGGVYGTADLNSWSLHPFYRRRLCNAFALKRVFEGDKLVARERDYDRVLTLSDTVVTKPWPKLVVCAAANVSDPGATPPGRGVTPFTFTHDYIGGPLVTKVKTADYEAALGANRRRDVTLPGAVAISGAAVSPSMGKITRRPLRFLMALANVRLGVWLPNPNHPTWSSKRVGGLMPEGIRALTRGEQLKEVPNDVVRKPRPSYLIKELLGRNRVTAKFLYVTDGGHYDNLGLVELLRRRCTKIYCFDASGGKGAKELGDAVALARSELNVTLSIDAKELIESGTPPFATQCVQHGTIKYADVDETGHLIYVRSVMTAGVSWDVMAFRDEDPLFPHHSTMDQLYTDQKFEAYRALGAFAGAKSVEEMVKQSGSAVVDRPGSPAPAAPAPTPSPPPARR